MPKKIILLGDPTNHGGMVISGSPNDTIDGKRVARFGDLVDCPMHGTNRIIEGLPSYCVDGMPVALEGHHTECGSVLIGTSASTVG